LNLVDRACVVAILLAVVTLANLAYHLIHKPTKLCLVGNRLDKELARSRAMPSNSHPYIWTAMWPPSSPART
jgi:hypothetical protein